LELRIAAGLKPVFFYRLAARLKLRRFEIVEGNESWEAGTVRPSGSQIALCGRHDVFHPAL
jgi:hypothetical protein